MQIPSSNTTFRNTFLTAMVAALLCSAAACQTFHDVEQPPAFRLDGIFTDHMVLQRDQPLPVWGWAAPGRAVTVETGPQSARTRANEAGRWRLTLPPLESGKGPLTMTVKAGDETIRLTDILVGDVWLCSGQSNMEMSVSLSADGKAEIKAANHPNIRLFNVPRPIDPIAIDPQDDIVGQWQACSTETIPDFSAVGYYFGREIHQRTNVQIGLINSSYGGTIIEAWTRQEEISRLPDMTERIEGSKIRLSFNHTGSGLASRDAKPLDWFEIAGKDGKFVKAQAAIDGDTVLVSIDAIAKPIAARFAWDQVAVPNLINKEGLPAGPFRTERR
jgi:hypothetical protein